jgi:hypothetical protein
MVFLLAVFVLVPIRPAGAHAEGFDIVVEVVNRSGDPTQLAYGIRLTFLDGHEVTGAQVTLAARSGSRAGVESPAIETTPGTYIADLTLEPGAWRVTVTVVSPDAEGFVEFTEEVGETSLAQPQVVVDTADPDRQGKVVTGPSLLEAPGAPEPPDGTALGLRVEALVRDAVAPLVVEYGLVTPSSGGSVSISAVSDRSSSVGPVSLSEIAPGVFHGVVGYPEAGSWEVSVQIAGTDAVETTFAESLPWPHYTTEAGTPKIKVDSEDPAREGTLIGIGDSPVFGRLATTTTTPAAETTPPTPAETGELVIAIPASGPGIAFQVSLRWLHLGAIGAWGSSIAALGLGRRRPIWIGLAVGGMVAVVATGTALALWGAPTPFPGIFGWSALGDRLQGNAYQWAFLIKMSLVLIAALATAPLVAKRTPLRLAVAAGGMLGALGAVVVMAQLHLFAHL